MTNGELFIVENPNIEFKLNGSCVWIYFEGVNHYTMPVSWWNKEIKTFEDIKAEIEKQDFTHHDGQNHWYMTPQEVKEIVFEIIDRHMGVKE